MGNKATLMAIKRVVELLVVNAGGNDATSGAVFANSSTVNSILSGNKTLANKQTTTASQLTALQAQVASLTTALTAAQDAITKMKLELGIAATLIGSDYVFDGVTPLGITPAVKPLVIDANASINGGVVQTDSLTQAKEGSGVNPVNIAFVARANSKSVLIGTFYGNQSVTSGNLLTLTLLVDGIVVKAQPIVVASGVAQPTSIMWVGLSVVSANVGLAIVQTASTPQVFTGLDLVAMELRG